VIRKCGWSALNLSPWSQLDEKADLWVEWRFKPEYPISPIPPAQQLLNLAGYDELLAETRTCMSAIPETLQDEKMIRQFMSAEALRYLPR